MQANQQIGTGKTEAGLNQLRLHEHELRLKGLQAKQAELRKMESRQKFLLRASQGGRARSASQENVAMTQAQEMMMRHSLSDGTAVSAHTNIDPFLGGEHPRQESADSGLGMGSNFNLGSIPEDMGLENMDTADLDTTLTEGGQQGGVPVGGAGASQQQPAGMETEELIPSLPELGEELSQDIMQTILNPAKVEPEQQLWL